LVVGEDLVYAEGDVGELREVSKEGDTRSVERTSKDDSTGLPRALTMPHPPRKMAVVMATPIRMASTLLISGKVVMRHRK
jgi:hypothetical protein